MHHFIYPLQDTYITNRLGYSNSNFGLDEMLRVDTTNVTSKYYAPTSQFSYSTQSVSNWCVAYFTGLITSGSLSGSSIYSSGSILNTAGTTKFTSSYFNGILTGSYNGWITSSALSSSNFTGSLVGFSGSISATGGINGFISGSLSTVLLTVFDGYLYGFSGRIISGVITGTNTLSQSHVVTQTIQTTDRSLIKFNITEISKSIASGDIVSPEFKLNLRVARQEEVPLQYSVYAMPISQSWAMGTGYWSDGGSTDGASWNYRDNSSGNVWYPVTDPNGTTPIDFITHPGSATGSWARGGATWYLGYITSQSFGYKIGDISMNVTPIANAWLSGTIPNEGFILFNSSEQTLDNNITYFFSQDTNTIYSPYLDVGWNDVSFVTGSNFTESVRISTIGSGITASIQSGSFLTGGISGSFSASTALTLAKNYITTSNEIFNDRQIFEFSGSFTGSLYGNVMSASGIFTGSGNFSASYFTGSIDGINTEYTQSHVISGSVISGLISGSMSAISYVGLYTGGIYTTGSISLIGTGSGTYLDVNNYYFSGFIDGIGISGNIDNSPVFGYSVGTMTITSSIITGSCGKSFVVQLATGSFISGPFSGSTFTAYYSNHKFTIAYLTGSWNIAALLGSLVYIPIPSGIDPYAYAHVQGTYVNGNALGLYEIYGTSSNSASFVGQFIDGMFLGDDLILQLSGSVYTSSFSYTSSVVIESNDLEPVEFETPFVTVIQNLPPTVKAGNIIRVNVFSRPEFPLKNFNRKTQFSQFLTPQYLPNTSYYAIKDNETEQIIVDFDNYTKISCDISGSYFFLDTTGLPQERYFKILIKTEQSGSIYTFDKNDIFKIVR